MALKIRLKPEEKVSIGASSVRNVGIKACEILIESHLLIAREGYKPPRADYSQLPKPQKKMP